MPDLRNFKPFSLLLTGTPGWLCETILSQLGQSLPALTRVRCLVDKEHSAERLKDWRRANPSVTETVVGNLREARSLEAACENMRGGVVVHASDVFHPEKISDYGSVNRAGALALASAAKKSGVRRFVFVSSTAVHGAAPSATTPFTEHMPCRPLSHYGMSKLEAEQGLMHLHEPDVFEVAIVRHGPLYGLPVPGEHLELFKDVQENRARLVGGGEFAQSWSLVDDVAAGVIACLTDSSAAGQTFILCDPQSHTRRDILTFIADALSVKPQFRNSGAFVATWARWWCRAGARFDRYYKSLQLLADQCRHTGASCQKAQKLIGFKPRGNLPEGLHREVAWCRDHGLID